MGNDKLTNELLSQTQYEYALYGTILMISRNAIKYLLDLDSKTFSYGQTNIALEIGAVIVKSSTGIIRF